MPAPATRLRTELRASPPRTVLVIKPSSLGDVVHALAPVAALRRHWPRSKIAWVVNPAWAGVLEGGGLVDRVIPFPRDRFRGAAGLCRFLAWSAGLRSLRPDLALDLQGLLRSAWIGRRARPRRLVGLSDAREGATLLTPFLADVSGIAHAVDRYLEVVRALGVPADDPAEFPLPPGEPPPVPLPGAPFVALHPYARGAGKSLDPAVVAALAHALAPTPVVLIGQGAPVPALPDSVLDLAGRTTLPQVIGVLRRAAFTVSVDSGPMHLASALSDRVLALHGWTDPRRVGPHRREALVWKAGRVWRAGEYDGTPGDRLPGADDVPTLAAAVRAALGGPDPGPSPRPLL